jgi:hypothetical protein
MKALLVAEAIVAANDCADARRDAAEKCARATNDWVPIFQQVVDDCTLAVEGQGLDGGANARCLRWCALLRMCTRIEDAYAALE